MAKLPKHIARSGPPTAEPINKISAMGISYREPQNIERELSPIEEIQIQFKALENSVFTLNKTQEKSPRLLAPVEVHEIVRSIKRANRKSNLTEAQIDHLVKIEVRRKNEIKAKRIHNLTIKSIPQECIMTLSSIKKALRNKQNIEIIRNICKVHIEKIESYKLQNFEISEYASKLRQVIEKFP